MVCKVGDALIRNAFVRLCCRSASELIGLMDTDIMTETRSPTAYALVGLVCFFIYQPLQSIFCGAASPMGAIYRYTK